MQTATNTLNQHAQKIAEELTHYLADTYALYLKTQNFHWNVTGPTFYSLHKMFEEQYQELAAATDEIAERIRALGSAVPASFSEFSKLTSIKEEGSTNSAENMLKKLCQDHETLSQQATMIIAKSQEAEDEATTDLLIQRQRAHDKAAWMLRSSIR
jgi:starvation-inducible DNA-binding protein